MDNRVVELKIGQSQALWKLLGPSLYSSRPLFPITIRELAQNAYDAQTAVGETAPLLITVSATEDRGTLLLKCEDQGIGMAPDIIFDKFLALGETGKTTGVGGYGIAKAAILGACSAWSVRTSGYKFSSSDIGNAGLTEVEARKGTEVILAYAHNESSKLKPNYYALKEAVDLLIANEKEAIIRVEAPEGVKEIKCGGLRVEESCLLKIFSKGETVARVYQIPAFPAMEIPYIWWVGSNYDKVSFSGDVGFPVGGQTYLRLGGQTQAVESVSSSDAGFNLVVDIITTSRPGESDYPLTASRERLTGDLREEIGNYIQKVFRNPRTEALLFKERSGKKKVWKIFHQGETKKVSVTRTEIKTQERQEKIAEAQAEMTVRMTDMLKEVKSETFSPIGEKKDATQITSKVSLDNVLPLTYLQQTEQGIATFLRVERKYWNRDWLSDKNYRLLRVWTIILETLMGIVPEVSEEFGIGMVFDDDFVALRTEENSTIYYLINPTGYRLSHKVEATLALVKNAAHELAHAVYPDHGEKFTVLAEHIFDVTLKKVGFKQIKKWAALLK